jgi:transposase-like protein
VARRHDLNPNQVFAWRQLYRRGLLDPEAPLETTLMLPVKVSTPTVLPTERARPVAASRGTAVEHSPRLIEIRLSNGHSIVLYGEINAKALARVIALLVRR